MRINYKEDDMIKPKTVIISAVIFWIVVFLVIGSITYAQADLPQSKDIKCTSMIETGLTGGHIIRCIDKKYNVVCWRYRFNSGIAVHCIPLTDLEIDNKKSLLENTD